MAPSDGAPAKKQKTALLGGVDVDDLLDKLLNLRDLEPHLQSLQIPEDCAQQLCDAAREMLMSQPVLLELEAPLKVCGDIHGQYHDLMRLFEYGGFPPLANYLFLGDYVDRGKRSVETVCLLFAYKLKFPENFFFLRGNHESPSICRIYGFYDECKRKYSPKMWKTFCDVFNCMPVSAVISDKVICMHGGLSPDMMFDDSNVRQQILAVERPCDVPENGLLCDLLWSDPQADIFGFAPNDRGVSIAFGVDILQRFLAYECLDLVVRAHQVVEDGYEFFGDRQLVTLFSAANYCGEFDNAAAVMTIKENLFCSFHVLKPKPLEY